jgi:23S rRNA pseudouridine955/2504/2580 synthase
MGLLGFDVVLGDAMPLDDGPPPATRAVRKARARAHAKTVRKERRGERGRRRGGGR